MGKLIVSAQMTIDGVIDHDDEWFIGQAEHEDAGFDELRSADTLLLGRKTYARASCGAGSKGDRTYAWAWIATESDRHHLLVRRNLTDPTDVAFFYTYVPDDRPATLYKHEQVSKCGCRSNLTSLC